MSVAVAINSVVAADPGSGIDFTQAQEIVSGSLTLSGNYGNLSPANGDTMAFASDKIKSQQIPLWVRVYQSPPAGTAPIAYSFIYAPGTTALNGVLIVISIATGLPLADASAYPAALTNGVVPIRFQAGFASFV